MLVILPIGKVFGVRRQLLYELLDRAVPIELGGVILLSVPCRPI